MRVYWTALSRWGNGQISHTFYKTNKQNGMHHTFIGRCSRAITLRQLKNGNKWYERKPETVVENKYVTAFVEYAQSY